MTTGFVSEILPVLEDLWKLGSTLSMVAKIRNYIVIDRGANLTKELSLIGLTRVELRLDEAKLFLDLTAFAAHQFEAAQQDTAYQSSNCTV